MAEQSVPETSLGLVLCCALALGTSTGGMKGPYPAWSHRRKIPLWSRTSCLTRSAGPEHGVSGQQAEGPMETQYLLCTGSNSVSPCLSQAILLMSSSSTTMQKLKVSDLCPKLLTLIPLNRINPMTMCSISTCVVCWWPFSKVTSKESWFACATCAMQSSQLGSLEEPKLLRDPVLTSFQLSQVP